MQKQQEQFLIAAIAKSLDRHYNASSEMNNNFYYFNRLKNDQFDADKYAFNMRRLIFLYAESGATIKEIVHALIKIKDLNILDYEDKSHRGSVFWFLNSKRMKSHPNNKISTATLY